MWFLHQSDLRISIAGKHKGIIKVKYFQTIEYRQYIPNLLIRERFQGTVVESSHAKLMRILPITS